MTNNTENTNTDFFSMSDEEFAKLDLSTFGSEESEEEHEDTSQNDEDNDTMQSEEELEDSEDTELGDEDPTETDESNLEDTSNNEGSDNQEEESTDEEEEIDSDLVLEAYKKITSPFKANGKEIQIKDADEVIALMQKGANYTQKMQTMAPHFRIIQTLEKNGLLTEDKINYLIDLSKNNPEAIKKLIKESELDTWELTEEQDSKDKKEYRANDHIISNEEYNLREVISRVTESDSGKLAMEEVNKVWDDNSRDTVIENPQILEVITNHIDDGTYEAITTEMHRLNVIGKLNPSKSFIENYLDIGNSLSQAIQQGNYNQNSQRSKIDSRPGKAKTKNAIKTNKAKHASSGGNSTQSEGSSNLFDLSDEEFLAKSAEYEKKFLNK